MRDILDSRLKMVGDTFGQLAKSVHDAAVAESQEDSALRRHRLLEAFASAKASEAQLRAIIYALSVELAEVGSQLTAANEYPECIAVGSKRLGFFASGVLLNEHWLLTSAHCIDADKMFAGISVGGIGKPYRIEFQARRGLLAIFKVFDFDQQILPPLLPEDSDPLDKGDSVCVVAFGNIDTTGGYGEQRVAKFRVDEALSVRIFATSQSAVCRGDSGGPMFRDDNNRPRRLVGICDSTDGATCRARGTFATLIGAKAWIEGITGSTFGPTVTRSVADKPKTRRTQPA